MNQPATGAVSSNANETTIMIIWPSIALFPSGQWLGRLFMIKWPDIYIFRVGNLLALLSIPHAMFLYFCRIAPKIGIRYRLTNRHLIVERGLAAQPERSIALTDFDEIKIQVQAGQEWFHAGDLVFLREGSEVFRLGGVSRPEPFRQTCLKVHQAYRSVAHVRSQQEESVSS